MYVGGKKNCDSVCHRHTQLGLYLDVYVYTHTLYVYIYLCMYLVVLGIQPRALCMLAKCSAIVLPPQPSTLFSTFYFYV
jgi:hypothetical protein